MATLSTKLQLLRGLLSGERAYGGPSWLNLDVTRRCNNTCLGCRYHCVQERAPSPGDQRIKDLPRELVRRICAQLPAAGTSELVLVGEGEPFLHPRLLDDLSDFVGAGFRVQLFTNGTLLDEERVRGLVECGLQTLNVTFWAVDEEEHRTWHPGVRIDYLERRREGVRRLRQARGRRRQPRINLQFPLTRVTYLHIPERVALARSLGCDAVTFGFFRDWVGAFADQGLLPADVAAIRGDLRRARRALESAGIAHNIDQYLAHGQLGHRSWTRVPCYSGWYQTYVKVDGTVKPCDPCALVMGNLLEQDFDEVWNGARYRSFRRQSSSLAGLVALAPSCACANCCMVKDNLRVHRVYRHLAPLAVRLGARVSAP